MDPDFTALASRVAARAEVLGCVILSRDGLVLGSFPPNGEGDVTPGLLRFAQLGDPDRGFVQFSDELWAYVREGSYAAFAVAGPGTRPGILIDYLEQALLVAEEARVNRSAVSEPTHVDLSPKVARIGKGLRATSTAPPEELRLTFAEPAPTPAPARAFAPDQGRDAPEMSPPAPMVPSVPGEPSDVGPSDGAEHRTDVPGDGWDTPERAPDELGGPAAESFDFPETLAEAPQGDDNDRPDAAPAAPMNPADVAPVEVGQPELGIEGAPPGTAPDDESPKLGEHEGARNAFDGDLDDSGTAGPFPVEALDSPESAPESPDEIDRVALAREFAQLLQDTPGAAESAED